MFLLSVLLQNSSRLQEACGLLERAVQFAPNNLSFLSNLGGVYARLGRSREALGVLFTVIAGKPDFAQGVVTLALTFEGLGELPAAAECYQRALELEPGLYQAAERLKSVRVEQSVLVAVTSGARNSETDENPADLFTALGATLRTAGAADHATSWYRAALRLNPQSAYVHTALGAIHSDAGRFDEAVVDFQRALAIDETFDPARGYLDTALDEAGRHIELEAVNRDAIALHPDDPLAQSVLLFNMQFWPHISASDILAEARAWNARHARPLTAQALPLRNDRSPERRLRIGYVSPDFKSHVLSLYTIPLLQNHAHREFEIYCYSSVDKASSETARIRASADVWREVAELDDSALANVIRQDQIDILVDITMHMIGRRLLTFARRPAPIQITWLAYPGTTGLEAMDYRLSDPFLDPPGESSEAYTEETLRLPDSFWCYDPLTNGPEVSPLPALARGRITFGCLNHFRKVNDGVLRLWARVLSAVPDSRLLLLAPEGNVRHRIRSLFDDAGVKHERVEFVGRCTRLDYLIRYRQIDICLDTFPYNGHTTSLDALWMGVPTVTLAGETVVGRAGVCQAMNVGLPELVASTHEQYVQAAASLAGNLEHLSVLRQTLRARLQQSPLMDAPRFARNLESIYRDVWRRFCANA
jgi:predicted O-linked N-acetylglucosamine transferase (SPINDLY family)